MMMLEIKDLHATVGDKEILKGVNLSIEEGEVMAIMGQMVVVKVHCLL